MTKEICPTCNGEKLIDCPDCESDQMQCSYCEGTGTIPPGEAYQSKVCEVCEGSGFNCTTCNGSEKIKCDDCDGEGFI